MAKFERKEREYQEGYKNGNGSEHVYFRSGYWSQAFGLGLIRI